MITSLGYERGYLEWGIAYMFPWKGQTKLRFNLNSPSFKEERKHWRFYIGDISHEEIHCTIYFALLPDLGKRKARETSQAYDDIQHSLFNRVKNTKVPMDKRLSYNGFLNDRALNNLRKH